MHSRRLPVGLLLGGLLKAGAAAETQTDPAARLDLAISAAESHLEQGDLVAAESLYREALFQGWLLIGTLERLEGRLQEARAALGKAADFRIERADALQSLALALLQGGEAAQAVEILSEARKRTPADTEALRLLAKALAAAGQLERALETLDAAVPTAAADPERTFLLATEYLWLKRVETAQRLFAEVVAARPIPQTRVLIGRSYRDAGEYARARTELRAALDQDPGVRRAHYYLGMVELADATTGPDRLEKAIAEFREELKLAPEDPLANDQLGTALLDAGRQAEALPVFETAIRGEERFLYVHHLGRGLLAAGRIAEAATATRRALELAVEQGASDSELEKVHYQLALALRRMGSAEEAASHLAEARRLAAHGTAGSGDGPASGAAPEPAQAKVRSPGDASSLSELPLSQRRELRSRATTGLARAYFNLGVLQAQGQSPTPAEERFARAAGFFEAAARVEPDFPQVQPSLGVAYFNARQFDKASAPLARALAAHPEDGGLKRMLAMSWLNTGAWQNAATLLQDDPARRTDAALQYAYGLALLRSQRAAEAERVLTELLAQQADSAELSVLLGQAYAQQEKHERAIELLTRALQLKPDVADANATLGSVYAKQGRFAEALAHLEAAVRLQPEDAAARDQLGRAYQELGRTELARQQFEASRRLKAKR